MIGICFQFLYNWYGFEHGAKSFQGNQHKEVSEKFFHSPDSDNSPSTQKELVNITVRQSRQSGQVAQRAPE